MMWVWWMTQLVFIFLVEVFRYIAVGVIIFLVAKNILTRLARR
jgi:hypothetical protein